MLVAGGGGNGLGRLFAEVYAMKGVRGVAVLDVRVPEQGAEREEWEERGIRWFQCDVARREEVERAKDQIFKEVCFHSVITSLFKVADVIVSTTSTPTLPSSSTASPPPSPPLL